MPTPCRHVAVKRIIAVWSVAVLAVALANTSGNNENAGSTTAGAATHPRESSVTIPTPTTVLSPVVVAVATTSTSPATTTTATTTATVPLPPVEVVEPTTVPATVPVPVAVSDDMAVIRQAFAEAVPGAWRDAIIVSFQIIDGDTSHAHIFPAEILITKGVVDGPHDTLLAVLAHEFGHEIAYSYSGSPSNPGNPPEGWPGVPNNEVWAECVATVFAGRGAASSCPPDQYAFTSQWLASGPASHVKHYSAPPGL